MISLFNLLGHSGIKPKYVVKRQFSKILSCMLRRKLSSFASVACFLLQFSGFSNSWVYGANFLLLNITRVLPKHQTLILNHVITEIQSSKHANLRQELLQSFGFHYQNHRSCKLISKLMKIMLPMPFIANTHHQHLKNIKETATREALGIQA